MAATNYNPWENAALARRADAETEYQQELNAVNIKVQQAQADAQVRKIELDGELQQAQIEIRFLR